MKVGVAIDSFKGSLSSLEAGNAVKAGIRGLCDEVVVVEVGDGGEGSIEAMMNATNSSFVSVQTFDPLRRKISAKYAKNADLAIMEMASSSGLTLLSKNELNPLKTDTYGFGVMIKDAISKGVRKFIIAIGGSATNDGGMGMLEALGYKFFDEFGLNLAGNGENLNKICEISDKFALKELKKCEFLVACDVDNPLFGKNGAAYIYAPQKGADKEMVKILDAGLRNFAKISAKFCGTDNSNLSGSGAAGGLGFGLVSFLGAELKSGFEIIAEICGIEAKISDCDLIITGEGQIDHQSVMGKTPMQVAKIAKKYGICVIALSGCIEEIGRLNEYIDACFCILQNPCELENALKSEVAKRNLASMANQTVRLFMASKSNHKEVLKS